MAITNAQQYKQLLAKGGRIGFQGGGADASTTSFSDSYDKQMGNDPGTTKGNTASDKKQAKGQRDADKTNQRISQSDLGQTQTANNAAAIAKGKAEKAAADKKAKKRENLIDKSKKFFTNIKEKNKKFQNRKNVELANKRALQKYQDIEQYVDMVDDYGLSAEQIAEGLGIGAVDKGLKASLLGKDSIYEDGLANKFEVAANMAGLDINKFQDLGQGKEFLGSNIGTGIESFRPNLYDVNSPLYGIAGSLVNKIRPDTQVTVLNTLQKARDYRDLAGTGEVSREDLENLANRGKTPDQINPTGGEGGGNQVTDPCKGPNPPAYCNVGNDTEEEDATPTRNLGGLAPRFAGSIFDFTGLADGGRVGAMDGGRMMMMANEEEDDPTGGIMDLESGRQMYFLGKLVKKATRAVKKVVKSPVGKAALMYFGGNALMNAGGGSFFGNLKTSLLGQAMKPGYAGPGIPGILQKLGLTKTAGSLMPTAMGGILAASTLPLLMGQKEEEDNNDDYYKTNRLNIADVRNNPYNYLSAANQGSMYAADGGLMRNGYQEGGDAEPVAKKTMPLLDMDGQEMDLREEGGFVPLGRMERADDVPARLSKNEFVFTADAVRNAGEGDVDKGAEVMYNMMKNLESGGEVSEESQGLDGAREMFKTSQRLEEVI
jgi:hypothetical protein